MTDHFKLKRLKNRKRKLALKRLLASQRREYLKKHNIDVSEECDCDIQLLVAKGCQCGGI